MATIFPQAAIHRICMRHCRKRAAAALLPGVRCISFHHGLCFRLPGMARKSIMASGPTNKMPPEKAKAEAKAEADKKIIGKGF